MSRRSQQSQGSTNANPAIRFYDFQGSEGNWKFYDKENKVNVPVKNMVFMIVKEFATIIGYNKQFKSGIWSNEIENTSEEELDVRWWDNEPKEIKKGLYSDIKDHITSKKIGAKFAKSIYITLYNPQNKEWELCNLKISGTQLYSFGEMMNAVKASGSNIYECVIKSLHINNVYKDEGQIKYYYPKFEFSVVDDSQTAQKAALLIADQHYEIVDAFHKERIGQGVSKRTDTLNTKKANKVEVKKEEPVEDQTNFADADDDDDLPF